MPEKLINEVGPSLATLIAEASSSEHQDTRQRLIIRGGPVHKTNSLMQEEADLSEYESCLCSSVAVVNRLVHKGVLTRGEGEIARVALNMREVQWRSEPEIADEALLYLDDLTVSHFEFLGLLSKLHRAGFTAVVSNSEIEEADDLISYDQKASDVVSMVNRLRLRLQEGFESEKVRLGKAIRNEDTDGPEHVSSHPTVDLLKLVADADVGVVDDRFINQHNFLSLETESRPLITTVDVLDILVEREAISRSQRQDALTTLRRANFALMPTSAGELSALIAISPVREGVLEETAELKAIREGIQRIRMSNMLQSPKELTWLNGVIQACLLSLKELWTEGLDESRGVAQSDWLLELSDVREWTHRLDDNVEQLTERHRNWVLLLMTLPVRQVQSVKEAYWRWFDSRILEPLQEEDPDTYRILVDWAKEHVAGSVKAFEQSAMDDENE